MADSGAAADSLGYNFPGVPTMDGQPPTGYRRTVRTRVIGHGARELEAAAAALLRWRGHCGTGFIPVGVPDAVTVGAVSRWRVPWGPLRPMVTCRVFDVEATGRRRGFGHGALEGHPQSGWETYTVRLTDTGAVEYTVAVTWRPAAWWLRMLGPMMTPVLITVLRRNLRALDSDIAESRSAA